MATITPTPPPVPANAYTNGGQIITINGTNLDSTKLVLVGSAPAVIVSISATVLKFRAPANGVGTKPVRLLDDTTQDVAAGNLTYSLYAGRDEIITDSAKVWQTDVNLTGSFIDLSDPTAVAGLAWTKVLGTSQFVPTTPDSTADDSDNDSGAYGSDQRTQVKWQNSFTVKRGQLQSGALEDPAARAIRLSSVQLGRAASLQWRWFDRMGSEEAYVGRGMASWEEQSGGTEDLRKAQVTVRGQGRRWTIANPTIADPTLLFQQ